MGEKPDLIVTLRKAGVALALQANRLSFAPSARTG